MRVNAVYVASKSSRAVPVASVSPRPPCPPPHTFVLQIPQNSHAAPRPSSLREHSNLNGELGDLPLHFDNNGFVSGKFHADARPILPSRWASSATIVVFEIVEIKGNQRRQDFNRALGVRSEFP